LTVHIDKETKSEGEGEIEGERRGYYLSEWEKEK